MSEESEHPAEAIEEPVTDVETETLSEVVNIEAPKMTKVKKARSQKQIDALNTAREKLTKKRKDADMDELFRQRQVQEEINALLSANKQMRDELETVQSKEAKTKKKRKVKRYVSSSDDDASSSDEEERIEKKRKKKATSKPQSGNTVVPSNLVLRSLGF